MADINEELLRALNGPAPQHKKYGEQAFEFTEGEQGKLFTGNHVMTDSGLWVPQKGTDDGAINTQLTGSNVEEEYDGQMVLRTRQMGLSYKSWFFDDVTEITVTPGTLVEESRATHINGFSVMSVVARSIDFESHNYKIRLRWQTTNGSRNSLRSAFEDLGETGNSSTFNGLTETKAEYVFMGIENDSEIERNYHIAALLRV